MRKKKKERGKAAKQQSSVDRVHVLFSLLIDLKSPCLQVCKATASRVVTIKAIEEWLMTTNDKKLDSGIRSRRC